MNKFQKRRLYLILIAAILISVATTLILYALKQNINVFVTPKQIATANFPENYHFRLGGLVKSGSVKRNQQDLTVNFVVTDLTQSIPVTYTGILPDLFRENTGVIAEGSLNAAGVFVATQILAKHDENYMPKNVYQALREKNHA